MADIYDTFQATSAVWEIAERLIHHTQAGNMLAGLNYDKEGTLKVEGYDDLPLIQPYTLGIAEESSGGAPAASQGGKEKLNQPVAETLTLVYRVSTNRADGWVRRDPTDTSKRKGFLEWICLIRDAIETAKVSNVADTGLSRSVAKPIKFSLRESETTQRSFTGYLEVEIALTHHCRAQRNFTLPEIS